MFFCEIWKPSRITRFDGIYIFLWKFPQIPVKGRVNFKQISSPQIRVKSMIWSLD
jgi:hypothetical protein